ncbi:hypothetical protein FQN57_005849 [Myotisia sp. PD_48]|nr:hypothetical protein FQN57_005849 [Myotisia sp. PD_48]
MSSIKYLVTGATSGLGGSILKTLYEHVPDPSTIAAASSRATSGEKLLQQYPGIQFRMVDYDNADSLLSAFVGVERLFFVSSPEFDTSRRNRQHGNVVKAAKDAHVGHVYYSSLAFGGFGSDSKAAIQQAHLVTENLLKKSGIPYTSIRQGVYTDAFPVFIFWYPNTTTVYLSADGPVAFASREELGEASAKLMLKEFSDLAALTQNNEENIVLLTGPRTYTFADIVSAISDATGTKVNIEYPPKAKYPSILAAEDAKEGRGKKTEQFFAGWQSLVEAVEQGEVATVDPLMGELLGRKPQDAMEHVKQLILDAKDKGGYTWHQNY